MADSLPATIIGALLADEATRDATELAMALWATKRQWHPSIDIDGDLNVRMVLKIEDIYLPNGDVLGDLDEQGWLRLSAAIDAGDNFGWLGENDARKAADKLRMLADDIERLAGEGGYGKEPVA